MNRRGFLSLLASAAGVALADPEALLWRPGAKLISIPKAPSLITNFVTFCKVGDIITFGRDPKRYRVTEVAESCLTFIPS